MRLRLHLSPNALPVPFSHLHKLTGTLHRWLGQNDLHDAMSLYSFGWMQGGQKVGGELHFPEGATWNVSLPSKHFAEKLALGILQNDREFPFGMKVEKALLVETPDFGSKKRFAVDSPVVVRKERGATRAEGRDYLIWKQEEADGLMTALLRKKLERLGFPEELREASVRFDRTYEKARTKMTTIRKGDHAVQHRGNECPVWVEGAPEAVRAAWLLGVGDLTGSGFGALK